MTWTKCVSAVSGMRQRKQFGLPDAILRDSLKFDALVCMCMQPDALP